MGTLNRDEILRREDFKLEPVDVPEWGGNVFVRTLRGDERDKLDTSFSKNPVGYRAMFCGMCVCDEKGQRIFSDTDIHQLGQKSSIALDRIVTVGMRLNGLTGESVDELEKNSGTDTSGGSGSV